MIAVKKVIPSLLTTGNLAIGMVALVLAQQNPANAALLVIIGMVLDGLDGRVARWLHAESAFGKELDSLSDIVTFGVAPAFLMYTVALNTEGWVGVVIALLFPICGALRLARFNVQTKSTNYFVGLPITAAGGVLATMALYSNMLTTALLTGGMLLLSVLMVSTVRYPNFKKVPFPRSAIVLVPALAILIGVVVIFKHSIVNRLIFIPLALYALVGIMRMVQKRSKARRRTREAEQDVDAYKTGLK